MHDITNQMLIVLSVLIFTPFILLMTVSPFVWVYWLFKPKSLVHTNLLYAVLIGFFSIPLGTMMLFFLGPLAPFVYCGGLFFIWWRAAAKVREPYTNEDGTVEQLNHFERTDRENKKRRAYLESTVKVPPLYYVTDPMAHTVEWDQIEPGRRNYNFRKVSRTRLERTKPVIHYIIIGIMAFWSIVMVAALTAPSGDPELYLPGVITGSALILLFLVIIIHNLRIVTAPFYIDIARDQFEAGFPNPGKQSLSAVKAIQVLSYIRDETRTTNGHKRIVKNTWYQQNVVLRNGERVHICDSDHRYQYEENVKLLKEVLGVPVWDREEEIRIPKDSAEAREIFDNPHEVEPEPLELAELVMLSTRGGNFEAYREKIEKSRAK